MKLMLVFTISLSIPVCLSYSRRRGSQRFSYNRKSAKFSGEEDNKDLNYYKELDSINDDSVHFLHYPSHKISPSDKDTVIIKDRGIPVGVAEGVKYQREGITDEVKEEEKEIAHAMKPKGRIRQTLLMAQTHSVDGPDKYPAIHSEGDSERRHDSSQGDRDQELEDIMYSDETQDPDYMDEEPSPQGSYGHYDAVQSEADNEGGDQQDTGDTARPDIMRRGDAEAEGASEETSKAAPDELLHEEVLEDATTQPLPEEETEPDDVEEPDLELTKAELVKVSKEVEEPRLEPLEDWNYLRIRDLLSQLNNALHAYSNKLTKDILKGKVFQTRSIDCITKYSTLFSECKSIIQDKITLQQELDDMRNRYTSLEQVLAKVKDINEDNRQTIDKLRANRDQCVREDAEKVKTINSLRSRAVDLRRRLARFRGSIKQ